MLEVSHAESANGSGAAAGRQPEAGSGIELHDKASPLPSLQNGRRQAAAVKQESAEAGTAPSAQISGADQAAVKQEPASDAAASREAAAAAAGQVLRHAAGRCRQLLPLEFLRAELQVSRLSGHLVPLLAC